MKVINLEKEYAKAEKEYDLVAFDMDPNMVYELSVCYSSLARVNAEEEILCVKQTMREIKDELELLSSRITQGLKRLMIMAYEVNDFSPVPAYLVVSKELR